MDRPLISFVIIGLNVERFIRGCVTSIYAQTLYNSDWEIIYVDSSSSDKTLELVREFNNITIVHLDDEKPNAAKARNAGWKIAKYNWVHFLDADSYLKPDWIGSIHREMQGKQILSGGLVEREPHKNYFHEMADLDWQQSLGNISGNTAAKSKSFGGNVMIKKEILLETGGFNEDLFAGEDSDLSYRIREKGYSIYFFPKIMASHDIQTGNMKSYTKRIFRTGIVYTSLAVKYMGKKEKLFLKEVVRLSANSIFLISGILVLGLTEFTFTGLLLTAIPLKIFARNIKKDRPISVSVKYNFHLLMCYIIQFMGSLRFMYDQLHLTNSFNYYKNEKQVIQ